MQVAVDPCDRTTAYADLREQESLTDEVRCRAIGRARELGATHVEFWRPPYGQGADRMEGFLELARVSAAPEPESKAGELAEHRRGSPAGK
ncbi:MAG: hypothetical protein ACHQ53_09475 [Polyangiales bacterium]